MSSETEKDARNTAPSPFALENRRAYQAWRERKLAHYPRRLEELLVELADPRQVTAAEAAALHAAVARANLAIYTLRLPDADKGLVAALGRGCGLRTLDSHLYADDDGIAALQVSGEKRQFDYIPYSNHAISWHTDGYYNPPARRIGAMILHCVRPAAHGGANQLLDHEMVYLQLRDIDPGHIEALMHPEAMTIPANIEQGVEIRPAQSGPVFSMQGASGALHMRYTARTRSIQWRQDAATRAAVACLEQLLAADSPYVFTHTLQAGQGILCNNVLHTRSAFRDSDEPGQGRLMYRARYLERIV